MKSFVISSKAAFDPRLNPGMSLTAEHFLFVKALDEAKAEMDAALAKGIPPSIDAEKLKLIMTHVRYCQNMSFAYRRDVTKLVRAVLACKTIATAGKFVCKAFRWDPEHHQQRGELVARAILQSELHKATDMQDRVAQELARLGSVSRAWKEKP